MEATQTPTQTVNNPTTEQLIFALTGVFDAHIKQLVDQRVNQIFEAHATVKQLDEQWEERVRGYVQEAMDEHESQHDHPGNDDISDTVATHIADIDFTEQIRRSVEEILSDGDYCTEERAQDIIKDALDDADWTEYVKEGLRGMCE